jgi:transcriptional regulator with XRE-family HTH domain
MTQHLDIQRLATALRRARGDLTLRDVARVTGVSASTLSRIERHQHRIALETFLALCDWLGVSPVSFCPAFADNEVQRLQKENERLRSALWSLSDAARKWAEERIDDDAATGDRGD